jgi:DNA-binding PadR family transcriptional regulator
VPPRVIGLYALASMEREGKVYGYQLSQGIAERTGGAWRPGAGAVYPSLRALVERGLARRQGVGRRREYRITPEGRRLLGVVRRRAAQGGRSGPDPGALWAEIVGAENLGRFLLRRLERSLDALGAFLERTPPPPEADEIRRAARKLVGRRPTLRPAARPSTRRPRRRLAR